MPKALDNQRREALLAVRLSPGELDAIRDLAEATGLPPSTYLRQVGLAYEPRSTLDQQAVRNLALLRGDLGRVGGLLRMWLSNDERHAMAIGMKLPEILDSIRRSEASILEALQRLVPPE